jgi:hypothetical protein
MDWILDSENRLNGARVATVRVRPLRLAYIVPDDDPQIVRRVIHSCCLTWGGVINPLIPYSRAKGFSPAWLEILPGITENGSGVFHFSRLLSLTKAGLNIHGVPYGASTPEEPQDKEAFTNKLIVTGKRNCVSDLCLYWDLRIEQPSAMFLPLWIPLDFLVTEDGLRIVRVALQRADRELRGFGINPSVYVVSTSVNKRTLEDKLRGKLDDVKYATKELYHFVSGKWDYYHVARTERLTKC